MMAIDLKNYKAEKNQIEFEGWLIETCSGRILASTSDDREKFESQLSLPSLPEMIFSENVLKISRIGFNFQLLYNALDALSLVDSKNEIIKVATSKTWVEARHDSEHITNIIQPFDWTFSTEYIGTIIGKHQIEATEQKIDIEKLKRKDKILFYSNVILYEDELHDFGTSSVSVKIRVMPDYFLILLRFFLRVDDVIYRINDTRFYFQIGTNYILREYKKHEGYCEKISIPLDLAHDPDSLSKYLPLIKEESHLIYFDNSN